MIPMSLNNQNQGTNWFQELKNWWISTPFFNKALIIASFLFYLLNVLTNNLFLILMADIPLYTLKSFQIWRVITAFIVHMDLLSLFFCLLSMIFESRRLEGLLGSVAFFIDVLVKNIEIQIVYLFLMFLLHFMSPEFLKFHSCGLWDLVMVYITIRSASNPEQDTNFLCLPITIKAKYYPFLIILLFSVISMTPFSLIAAMIVGYIETYFFNGVLMRISRNRAIWFENKLFPCVKQRPDFLSAESLESPYFQQQVGSFVPSNPNYLGGRGVQIGGSVQSNPPLQRPIDRERGIAPQIVNPPQTPAKETKPFTGKAVMLGTSEENMEEMIEVINKDGKKYESLTNESEDKKDKSSLI